MNENKDYGRVKLFSEIHIRAISMFKPFGPNSTNMILLQVNKNQKGGEGESYIKRCSLSLYTEKNESK